MRWGRVRCSFCGKDRESVAKLVAGRNSYICDACVGTAASIIEASNGPTPRTGLPATPSPRRRLRAALRQFFGVTGRTLPAIIDGTA